MQVFLSGHTLEDARAFGWLGKLTEPADCVSVFKLYSFSDVHWEVLPHQVPIWCAMTIVVAFSSCLDVSGEWTMRPVWCECFHSYCLHYIPPSSLPLCLCPSDSACQHTRSLSQVAAIEMDMGSALDTNAELITVGISNALSGLLGGFTGSYIFSQVTVTSRHIKARHITSHRVIIYMTPGIINYTSPHHTPQQTRLQFSHSILTMPPSSPPPFVRPSSASALDSTSALWLW